jgi:hypothetical protein
MLRHLIGVSAACVLIASCGSSTPTPTASSTSPAAPSPTPSPQPPTTAMNLAGDWTGRATDSQGAIMVSWTLTQSGGTVTGTVKTQSLDPTDGSCNSCHRNKSGTVTGVVSDTTLSLTMFFAAGANGDPTPACSATLSGSASSIANTNVTTTYSGSDTCEGPFTNGTMAMTRR